MSGDKAPEPSPESETLVKRLAGPSTTKAGSVYLSFVVFTCSERLEDLPMIKQK
jgi:hypothetical protein